MKVLKKILIVASMLIVLCLAMYYDAFHTAPSRYRIRYETLSDRLIPEQMDGVTILFFSDLDYGTFMNQSRLSKLTDKINEASPDIILFGGDMFDQAVTSITDQQMASVSQAFTLMEAPLGKFAVLGDFDHSSSSNQQKVEQVLYNSGFELLENTSVLLRNKGSQSITLIGLDDGLSGQQDIQTAYSNVSKDSYQIALCHTPDSALQVPSDETKYMLAGHSHGGQVNWIFGALYQPVGAQHYLYGRHRIARNFTLDITNGTGTTIEDVRFLANAEVVVYRLHHLDDSSADS